ncbi:MAG: potassium channel protein [Candidatus Electrothrix aestuarii]|uniref:Potassium channel protein n=1 Tax=Candidatus Electrothrix aestuarii TaxID=3062594 RepID=A0AAU8LRR2_9BACT|nr:potassium channel protein [Candidatus Electrothrix aestuarii]WPD21619.1 MAG: potassium channel protein [Candidatus Electrothrix sp. GW3-3]
MRKYILFVGPLLMFLVIGPVGYIFLEGTPFIDGLYLTMITISTVGYGDIVPTTPAGRLFTVLLIFSGVGYVMYMFSQITEAMVEGGLQRFVEKRKMHKKMTRLQDHYIICGFGRIGQEICAILRENYRSFVVIENEDEVIREIDQLGYIVLKGDASDDEVLEQAGIKQARGLVAVVSTDADNLYITLTARGINPGLFILTRSSGTPGVAKKLERAGATKVISPYSIGARRMAQLIVRPTVVDFLDLAMQARELGLCMEELLITEHSSLVDKTLMQSGLRKKYDIIVVAIKRPGMSMIFNPGPDSKIQDGDILIVLGDNQQISALEKTL